MSIFVESFYQLWFVVAYSYRFCPLTPSTRLHMCERINLSVWVESIDIYTYMICAYTWHCTGSYHSSHIRIQNLLKKSTTSEQLLSLVIEVTSGTGMRVTSQHVGLWLPLFAAWNWQQLTEVTRSKNVSMSPCHSTNVFFSIEATIPTQLEPGLHFAKVWLWSCSFHQHHQQSYGFESFFLTESLQSAVAFALTWSVCMSQILASKEKKDEPEPEPFYIKNFSKRINTLSESTEN